MNKNQTHILLKLHPDYQAEMLKRQLKAIENNEYYQVDEAEALDLVNTLGPKEVSEEMIIEYEFYQTLKHMPSEDAKRIVEHFAKEGE